MAFAVAEVRNYQGKLFVTGHGLESKWVPVEDDPRISKGLPPTFLSSESKSQSESNHYSEATQHVKFLEDLFLKSGASYCIWVQLRLDGSLRVLDGAHRALMMTSTDNEALKKNARVYLVV